MPKQIPGLRLIPQSTGDCYYWFELYNKIDYSGQELLYQEYGLTQNFPANATPFDLRSYTNSNSNCYAYISQDAAGYGNYVIAVANGENDDISPAFVSRSITIVHT